MKKLKIFVQSTSKHDLTNNEQTEKFLRFIVRHKDDGLFTVSQDMGATKESVTPKATLCA